MERKRKLALVARKLSFKAAEEADNVYWSATSEKERLLALMDLRAMVFGTGMEKIQKIVHKRHMHEEA